MRDKETVFIHLLLPLTLSFLDVFLFSIWFWLRFILMLKWVFSSSGSARYERLIFSVMELGYLSVMARTLRSTLIPYEVFTYSVISLSLLFAWKNKSFKLDNGLLLMALVVFIPPLYGHITFKNITFTSGYIFVLIALFGVLKNFGVTSRTIQKAEDIWIIGSLTISLYAVLVMPAIEDIQFKLGANFQTTGGFGTNQFSAIVGSALFLFVNRLSKGRVFFKWRFIDFAAAFIMLRQVLLSFSRGGVVVFVIALLVMYLPAIRKIKLTHIIVIIFGLIVTFNYTNSLTNGKLLLRFKGETNGTIAGTADKTLDKITSNRTSIALDDFRLFLNNPVTGVGTDASTYLRENHQFYASHIELTRIMAELGVLGLLGITIFLIGVFSGGPSYSLNNNVKALICLALLTTFHNAVRTPVPILFLMLAYFHHKKIKYES